MLLLGLDIGSSSIKASVIDSEDGYLVASATSPEKEMPISSPRNDWAEQHPDLWWENVLNALNILRDRFSTDLKSIGAIGISYQMHGLVLIDKEQNVLRPSIIWCDSRTIDTGNYIQDKLGYDYWLNNQLNLPGNFTLSKLMWVKENEPEIFNRVYKFLLPGDYIALKLSGVPATTESGLSEGIFWNFKTKSLNKEVLNKLGIETDLVPQIVSTFGNQGEVTASAAEETGLSAGIPITYRSGDQPNNAFSLNVLNPGEVAATAGTSGVVYGITDKTESDSKSRVNTFVHVNNSVDIVRNGILMCLNGTGIQYSWLRNKILNIDSYDDLNRLAAEIPAGSEGLRVYPFGNGAQGAARGAGYGVGEYSSLVETFNGLTKIKSIFPDSSKSDLYHDLYADWIKKMDCMMDYK